MLSIDIDQEMKLLRAYEDAFRARGYKLDVQPFETPRAVAVTATAKNGETHLLACEYPPGFAHPVNYTVDAEPRADAAPPVIEWFLNSLPAANG
jgi:hypothetical protein